MSSNAQLPLEGLGPPAPEPEVPPCARCGKSLAGWATWDVVVRATGEVVEVCPSCAHYFSSVRQRRHKRPSLAERS